jgi:amino acid transporter
MTQPTSPQLDRGLNLLHSTSLNVANMLGAGPFITIPVLLGTMMGPQAMIGWAVALVIVICDGLIWAELGAAFPGTGGTYHYFREIFKGSTWGRLLPFLFIWQFLISATPEVASGYIGASRFALSLFPDFRERLVHAGLSADFVAGIVAVLMVAAMFVLLCQRIRALGWLGTSLVAVVLGAVGTIIVLGMRNFDPALLTFPADAFHVDKAFLMGIGAATSVAVYDYLGYYNICHLGEEVREPAKTIPRAVIISIVVVATLYVSMNFAILGVVPWQEALKEHTLANENIAGAFMTKLYGDRAGTTLTIFIIWTCLAGLFAMTLGYSRIIYAAAKNGDFFSVFGKLHPTKGYPWAALALLSLITGVFCFVELATVIEVAVSVRILIQFIGQIVALHVVHREKQHPLPFRMWLYPLPSLVALIGWVLLLATTRVFLLGFIAVIYASGLLVFVVRDKFALRPRSL